MAVACIPHVGFSFWRKRILRLTAPCIMD